MVVFPRRFASRAFARALAVALAMAALPPAALPQVVPPDGPRQPVPGAVVKADPARGEVIARRWCAECHVVARDQTQAKADVPPFSAIARRGNVTEDGLRRFLMNPHPVMPDMQLRRGEAADLAAWIEAQKD